MTNDVWINELIEALYKQCSKEQTNCIIDSILIHGTLSQLEGVTDLYSHMKNVFKIHVKLI